MSQLLVNVFTITLPAFGSVIQPHGLKVAGVGVTPTQVLCDRPSPIAAAAINATSVNFLNNSGVPQTAMFRVEYDHSIHADGATPVYWRGFTSPAGVSTAIYGSFSANIDQDILSTPSAVVFDTVEASNGVTLVAGSRLTVPTNGVYAISISPQLFHDGGGTETIEFWLAIDGVNVPRSGSSLEMGNNNNRTLPFIEIVTPMNGGQYAQWLFRSTPGNDLTLEHYDAVVGPPAIPAIPAAIASVKRLGDLP